MASIEAAINIIQTNFDTIQKHLISKRCLDTMPVLRKSVYEFFLQLDEKEIQIAFGTQNDSTLYELIFGALSDEDISIKKTALMIVG